MPDYVGDPYGGCRPQCVANSDCPSHFACLNNKCKDPCPGVCGQSAECHVSNHAPQCTCMNGFVGNPFSGCHKEPPSKKFLYQSSIFIWQCFLLSWVKILKVFKFWSQKYTK